MSERYQKIGEIDRNQYVTGAPIILTAGALLFDNQKKCVIGQLKFKNIGEKKVVAIQVKIDAYDIVGEKLAGLAKFQYLDLNYGIGEYFGDRTAIEMPDANTRSLKVHVLNVCFADGGIWNGENEEWNMLPEPQVIQGDAEYLKQYKIEFGPNAKFQFNEYSDLWQCVCGNYNKITRDQCTDCMTSKEQILHMSDVSMKEGIKKRLEEEEQVRIEKKKADKKRQRYLILAAVLCGAIAIAVMVFFNVQGSKKEQQYKDGIAYFESEEYSQALEEFQNIGDHKDAANYREYCEILLELENLYDGEVHNMAEICRRIDALHNFQGCNELYNTNKELQYVLDLNGKWRLTSWEKGYFDEYELGKGEYYEFENGAVREGQNSFESETYELLVVGYAHYIQYNSKETDLKIKSVSGKNMTVVSMAEDLKSRYSYDYRKE